MMNTGGNKLGTVFSGVTLQSLARRVGSLAAWGLCMACMSGGDSRGSALYPQTGAPLPRDQVATLSGHVAEVDGRDVSALNFPLELLPGCHVVFTPERWGAVGTNVSMAAQTGKLPFALPMQAGHFYTIDVQTQMQTTIGGSIEVKAIETDATGQQTRVFPITSDGAELAACGKTP